MLDQGCLLWHETLVIFAFAFDAGAFFVGEELNLQFIQSTVQVVKSLCQTKSYIWNSILTQIYQINCKMLNDYCLNKIDILIHLNLTEVYKNALNHTNKGLSIIVLVAFFE